MKRAPLKITGFFPYKHVEAGERTTVSVTCIEEGLGGMYAGRTHVTVQPLPHLGVSPAGLGRVTFYADPLVKHSAIDGTTYEIDPRWASDREVPRLPVEPMKPIGDPEGTTIRVHHERRIRGGGDQTHTWWGWYERGYRDGRHFDPLGGRTVVEITYPNGVTVTGIAHCSKRDNYCRKTGREIALQRAREILPLRLPERNF